jgi:predicted proteasome-type protease
MASYNADGIWNSLHHGHTEIVDSGESVQATADDPTKNEQDMFRDVLDFQQMFVPHELGKRVLLSAVGGNFKVTESVIQEIK